MFIDMTDMFDHNSAFCFITIVYMMLDLLCFFLRLVSLIFFNLFCN